MPASECPLSAAAHDAKNAFALIAPNRDYTFGELHTEVSGVAARAADLGVLEGEPVAVALPPGPGTAILLLGLAWSPAISFPVNPAFPADFLADRLDAAGARHLVAPYGAAATPRLRERILLAPRTLLEGALPTLPPRPDLHAPAAIILTSGTTGPPKAAALSIGNMVANARASNRNIPVEPGDRWLLPLPLYHIAGWGVLFRCMLGRAAAVIPGAGESIDQAIRKYGVTHVSLVAPQLYRLLQDPAGYAALRGLKAVLLGGSMIPSALIEQGLKLGLPLYTSYGMTETASQAATTAPGDTREHLHTSGRPLTPETLRIGPDGLIQVRGETLFLGYLQRGRIQPPAGADGWFTTGDLGEIDPDGYLRVLGRRDNGFVVSGENVQPEAIERRLAEHPDVMQAAVVPVPDPERAHVPVAFVELLPGVMLDEAALQEFVIQALPRFCKPRRIFRWPTEFRARGLKIPRADWIAAAERRL
jgi:O-succinylbenzoic acid--CoA ligase